MENPHNSTQQPPSSSTEDSLSWTGEEHFSATTPTSSPQITIHLPPASTYSSLSPPPKPTVIPETAIPSTSAPDTTLTFQTAVRDALDGIQYVMETFPPPGTTILQPVLAREPITVQADDKVVVLEEVTEFAVRVRKVENGEVGVIPAWNLEGPLERLARVNMAFNEVATCPAEILSSNTDDLTPATLNPKHHHARCPHPSRRVLTSSRTEHFSGNSHSKSPSLSSDSSSDEDDEDPYPTTPSTSPTVGFNLVHSASTLGRKKGRKVVFKVDNGKRKIFRYVHPPSSSNSLASREESQDDEADESQSQSQKRKRENEHSVAPSTDGEWYRAYFEDVPGDDIGSESESEDDDGVGGSPSNQCSSSSPNNQNRTTNSNSNSSPSTPPKPQLKKKEGDWWWSGWEEEEEEENKDDEDMSADEIEVEYVDRGRQPGAKQKGRKRVVPRLKKSVASLNVRSILGMDEDDGRGDVDLDLEYL